MADIQTMNSDMLEILKTYLEIFSFFNEKLDEIKADEILNINLELLKASILDLNINISNFKSNLQYNLEINDNQENTIESNLESNIENTLESNIENTLESTIESTIENTLESNIENTLESNQENQSIDSIDSIDKKNMLALFFKYLMQIDKNSILNNSPPNMHSINKIQNTAYDELD